jgi:hypothetical protein
MAVYNGLFFQGDVILATDDTKVWSGMRKLPRTFHTADFRQRFRNRAVAPAGRASRRNVSTSWPDAVRRNGFVASG